jgi:TonB family protein
MMERSFLKNVSMKETGEFKSQELYLETTESFEFRELDIQIKQGSELPKPHYPLLSKRLKEQGDVLVRACILGDVSRNTVTIYRSSGHQRLDQSALYAVKRWKDAVMMRFQPSILRCYQIPIRFQLTGE